MSEQLAVATPPPIKHSSLAILADRLRVDKDKLLETLRNTVFKGASNEEIMVLTVVANEYGLNPLIKELYAFPAKGGGIVPIVSIDGWIRMGNDHPQMDGLETSYEHDEQGNLVSCTCKIWRKDRSHPVTATEYLVECQRNTEPWKMKHRMLRHKAIIQAERIAFGFSGIHDEDEGRAIAESVTERQAKGQVIARSEPLNPFPPPAPALPEPMPDDAPEWTDEERGDA